MSRFVYISALSAAVLACFLNGCSTNGLSEARAKPLPVLEAMSVSWGTSLAFEKSFLEAFGKRNGVKTQFVPNSRLGVYQELLRKRTTEPDLLQIDVVWPSILADDLIDLTPYISNAIKSEFVPQLLQDYTVKGRLIALPLYVDLGILYYRPELLEKYGFHNPPATWDDLEMMAARIQHGERLSGNKDFWGYVWQGSATEGGTCNALEWQSTAGAGNFIEQSGRVHVRSPLFLNALRRATGWIGTISPPAEYVYREDDSINIWDAGQTAFMRNWASGYGHVAKQPGNDQRHFAVAPLPAGPGGHRGALGGMGVGVSKYAANRDLAIKALLEVTSEANDLARLVATEGIPSHSALLNRVDVKFRTLLLASSSLLLRSLVSRPALITGEKYEAVSREYSIAVNSVLRRKVTPEAAMGELEKKLVQITGLPAQEN